MSHFYRSVSAAAACVLLLTLVPTSPAQSLERVWKKDFPKPIAWYARTSANVLLIHVDTGLAAIDASSGKTLWSIWDLGERSKMLAGTIFDGVSSSGDRGRNVVEVPGTGVLLLNRVRPAGETERRLMALNLTTGDRLWVQPEIDDLMTAIPLYGRGEVILVSRRFERKAVPKQVFFAGGGYLRPDPILLFPFRFEIERRDLTTGAVRWSAEYPHTFTEGTASVQVLGEHLFLSFSNRVLGSIDLNTGKLVWEEGSKFLGTADLPLPVQFVDNRLIYGTKDVQAVDPITQKAAWTIDGLGKVSGIAVQDGIAVAAGDSHIEAVDLATAQSLWRAKTASHSTNLLYDRDSDGIIWADWRGLHSVSRRTGKFLFDFPLNVETHAFHIRRSSPETVVTFAPTEVIAFNFKTGKRVLTEGKLDAAFRANASLDNWPMPEDGEGFVPVTSPPVTAEQWDALRRDTHLSPEQFNSFQQYANAGDPLDAYETEPSPGFRMLWWIDAQTNQRKYVVAPGLHHDIDRRLGMVFAVEKNSLLGEAIREK